MKSQNYSGINPIFRPRNPLNRSSLIKFFGFAGLLLFFLPGLVHNGAAQCVPWSTLAWPVTADFSSTASPRASVRIESEVCVELDQDVYLDSLLIEGTLKFDDGANRLLNAHKIIVDGTFEVGTEAAPFTNEARIELTDGDVSLEAYLVSPGPVVTSTPMDAALIEEFHPVNEPNRTLLVRGDATLDLHGEPKASTWKLLVNGPVFAGTTTLTVFNGDYWNVGDQIVIASTDFDMSHAEVRTIVAITQVSPRRHALQLDAGLTYTHWAGRVGSIAAGIPNVYENAEIGLLTHNVKVYTPCDSLGVPTVNNDCANGSDCMTDAYPHDNLPRAHDGAEIRMVQDTDSNSPTARIQYVEIYNAGKYGTMGRYPVHFHELGPNSGSYVKGCSIRDSANRAMVIHGSQQILLEDNVVYNIVGHAYYLEKSSKPLFSLVGLTQNDLDELDNLVITASIQAGVASEGHALTVGAVVEDIKSGKIWRILDQGNVYVIKKENGSANVYGSKYDTAYNTLRHNLGLVVHGCSPLDTDILRSEGSGVFYFSDPRNVFVNNSAAGAEHSGFYYDHKTSTKDLEEYSMDRWHLCGDDVIDYTTTDHILLDTSVLDYAHVHAPYDLNEYTERGYAEADGVHCHGSFFENIAHSARYGFWAEEHQSSVVRLLDFTAYKSEHQAVNIKNKGFTEVIRLGAADNRSALWPATHAYHMGYTPRWLVADSHFIGESANTIEALPCTTSIYGVEVYEGHLHVTNSHFELFIPPADLCEVNIILPDPIPIDLSPFPDPFEETRELTLHLPKRIAAFGRHQAFPFYSNNPNNSVNGISFDASSRKVYFDNPEENASGQTSVMIHDLDASIATTAGSWIVANDDFIIPGQLSNPDPSAVYESDWNAFVVSGPPTQIYGQLIVEWCDDELRCDNFAGPSRDWVQQDFGRGEFGVIMGLEIQDVTDCSLVAGTCDDVLEAEHSVEGVHSQLGGNVLSGHEYEVSFWRNENGASLPLADLASINAMQIHLRYAPVGAFINVSVPVLSSPTQVLLYRGEEQALEADITATQAVGTPTSALEWYYDGAADRVFVYLDTAADYENASVLLLF